MVGFFIYPINGKREGERKFWFDKVWKADIIFQKRGAKIKEVTTMSEESGLIYTVNYEGRLRPIEIKREKGRQDGN